MLLSKLQLEIKHGKSIKNSMAISPKERFTKAIDSQFQHLAVDAIYNKGIAGEKSIRLIARRPEQLFNLGEDPIHGEKAQFEFRLSEVSSPSHGDEIEINGRLYRIEEEPRLDLHHLVWRVSALLQK